MNTCNDKKHIKVLLSSIKKIYNKARVSGELEIKELYYLNTISKILNILELEEDEIKQLETFYMDLSYYSNNICRPEIIKFYTTTKKSFVQGTKYHCDNNPLPDYREKVCVRLLTVTGANAGEIGESTLLTMSYIDCDDLTNTRIEVPLIDDGYLQNDFVFNVDYQCMKPNTLRVNNTLITDFNAEIRIGYWNVRFEITTCTPPS